MKDAKRNTPFHTLLSVLDRWIDRPASGGSTDCSSNEDEDETITFIEEDGSAFYINSSTIGTKLDRISLHARKASPAHSAVGQSIQSYMGSSAQSSMSRSSAQSSFEQSVQSSVEESSIQQSIQQIYDTREWRRPILMSQKRFDKNRRESIRERLMQGENRRQSEEGRKSTNEAASAKGIQLPMNDIFATGVSSAETPKLLNNYKSKRWTKDAKKRSIHNIPSCIPSYESILDDISVVTGSVSPDMNTILGAKAVVGTDSAAKSHASGGFEAETFTEGSSDLACNKKLQLSLPEKNTNPLSGDADLASTQACELVFENSLHTSKSSKFSILPSVKSEFAEVKVVSKKSATDSLAREESSRSAESGIEKDVTERDSLPGGDDDDLASTQGCGLVFGNTLHDSKSSMLSFLPWVKSEFAEVKVVRKKRVIDELVREENSRAAEGEIEKDGTERDSLSGDDDLASNQGRERGLENSLHNSKSKLPSKLSFLPWVKSEFEEVKAVSKKSATDSLAREEDLRVAEGEIEKEVTERALNRAAKSTIPAYLPISQRDSNRAVKATIPANLPVPLSQRPDKSQTLKREADKRTGERDNRKADIVPCLTMRRSFNPLKRSARKKSGKTTGCFSNDPKSEAPRSVSKGKPKKSPAFSMGSVETCSTSHGSTLPSDSQENKCKGTPQKHSTQEYSYPQTTVSAAQGRNKMKPAQSLEQPPRKCVPLTTQKSELCGPIQETMDKPVNEEIGANRKEQEGKLVKIALVPHPITTDVELDDKIRAKGSSLQRKEKSVRFAPAQKRRMFGFLRKRSSQEVKSPQGKRASTSAESVPSVTQATSSIMPIVDDHHDNNSIVDREFKSKSNECHKTNECYNFESSWYSASTVRRENKPTPKDMTPSKIGATSTVSSLGKSSSAAAKQLVTRLQKFDKEIAAKPMSPLVEETAHYLPTAKISARGKEETKADDPVLFPYLKQEADELQEMITEKRMLQAMSEVVQLRLKELEFTGDNVRENEADAKAKAQGGWMDSFFNVIQVA